MRIKICGITQPDQGQAIANLGATALGFILVPSSPRYVEIDQINAITAEISPKIDYIGVFAHQKPEIIQQIIVKSSLTSVQLHGNESPEFCRQLRQLLPNTEIIKALQVRDQESLEKAVIYFDTVDTLLLDAYHPQLLGGTGHTLDWPALEQFSPPLPWFLAGGLNPDNISDALSQLCPDGIDVSSGVERSPGDKDLKKVALLMERLQKFSGQ
jgi:phosphoribosylanthranilate isomerase